MINKKIIMFVGMVLLVVGVAYASGVVLFGGNSYQDINDGLVLDMDLAQSNYVSGTKTFNDNSGEGNDGVSNLVAEFTTDRYGKSEGAMIFNGTSTNYLALSSLVDIKTFPNGWSLFAWIKPYTTTTRTGIFKGYVFNIESSNKLSSYGGIGYIYSTGIIYDNVWVYVGAVCDNSTDILTFYINGVNDSSQSYNCDYSYGHRIDVIGTSYQTDQHFNGSISQAQIWERALSATEVMALYNSSKPKASASSSQSGLVGHWALDGEGYNSNTERITDKTPYENHGTNVGATLTTDRMGHADKAMSFGGNGYWINITPLNLGSTLTISAWAKSTASSLTDMLWCIDNDNHGPDLIFHLDLISLNTWNGADNPFCSIPSDVDEWHLYTTLISSGTTELYIDGELCGSANYANPTGTSLYISSGAGYGWEGSISDFRIYDRILSVDEINALYNSYRPKAGSGSLKRGLILDMPLKLKYTKDETVGSEIMTDRTPYSNDGQNNGASVGGGYSSFVPNDYVDCSNASSLQITNNISVFMWIKGGTPDHGDSIISRWDTGANKRVWDIFGTDTNLFGIQLSDDGTFSAGHRKQYLSSNVVYDNNWHQIGFTFNTVDLKLYVDGIESTGIANFNDSITFLDSNNIKLMMGANLNNGALQRYSQINLCDVKIYNRALLESEIKLLYDKGR